MATSITQAKPLLTAAELELFDQSRAEPVKSFTAKQLASKEKRARALRDKYRDLYQRQTVAQRGKAGTGVRGKAMVATDAAGKANARTQRKGEIMQEVLERFEARSALLEARAQRESSNKPTKAAKATVDKSAKPAAKKMASASGRKAPVKAAAKPQKAAAKTPAKSTAKTPAAATGKAKAPTKVAAKASVKRSATSAGKPKKSEAALSAVGSLGIAVNGAAGAVHIDHLTGLDPTERSHKAPSDMAPTHGGKAHAPDVNAPLDMVPAAQRGNPVRNMPGNIAIQGHVSSSVRRAQGKKDSR